VLSQVSGQSLLVFIGIPVLIIAVVALLVNASAIAGGPRYRPGLSWWAPPVWFGGPSDQRAAPVDAAELEAGPSAQPELAKTTGGASASW
jgi:hypothetical protein